MPIVSKLNHISNYLIDWSRVGELLKSGRHKYTFNEIIPRMFIGVCTSLPIVFYGFSLGSIIFSVIVFVISHLFVISSLINKRYGMKNDCDKLVQLLKDDWCECFDRRICDTCKKINTIMTDDNNLRSSQVWGSRRRRLNDLLRVNNDSLYYTHSIIENRTNDGK